jgi:biotin synthase-related radical SAM superfamily protein
MFNTKEIAVPSAREMYRVTYIIKYGSGDVTNTKFFSSYKEMINWVETWQSESRQILCIEEYIINKTGV